MGVCSSAPEVVKTDIVALEDKIRVLELRLEQMSIDTVSYQEELLTRALQEKCEEVGGEMGKLQNILKALQNASTAAEKANNSLSDANSMVSSVVDLIKNEVVEITQVSVVFYYGINMTWLEVSTSEGDKLELSTSLENRNSLMSNTALVRPGDSVKLCGLEPVGL